MCLLEVLDFEFLYCALFKLSFSWKIHFSFFQRARFKYVFVARFRNASEREWKGGIQNNVPEYTILLSNEWVIFTK